MKCEFCDTQGGRMISGSEFICVECFRRKGECSCGYDFSVDEAAYWFSAGKVQYDDMRAEYPQYEFEPYESLDIRI